MPAIRKSLAVLLVVLGAAGPCAAATVTLTGGAAASFYSRLPGSKSRGRVAFRIAPALTELPDPRCPATSRLRLATGDPRSVETDLPCASWRATGGGFVYFDARASAGGARRIAFDREGLSMDLDGDLRDAVAVPVTFVEASLTVDSTEYCGRVYELRRNTPARVLARGPTVACHARPNVILIDLDDARADGIDRMPALARLAEEGVRFDNAFTPNPTCCPSRASLLTGLSSLHHGTRTGGGPIGGADTFRESGADRRTLAVWLRRGGYRTAFFGKYLNGYTDATEGDRGPGGTFYIPPGWDRWWGVVDTPHYGGVYGQTYEVIEEDGRRTVYDDHDSDDHYLTDFSALQLRSFLRAAVAEGRPFFAYWAPVASHVEVPGYAPIPAERHIGALPALPLWRPPSWSEPDLSDKPRWLNVPPSAFAPLLNDGARLLAYEALLAVDEQLEEILDLLGSLGVDEDTLVILTSDNGVTWGEHGLFLQRKACPYEECQRVPLLVRYPRLVDGAPTGVRAPVLNLDLAPTIASLAGVEPPSEVDGASLEPFLRGAAPPGWRTDYLLESWQDARGSGLSYTGQPADGDRLRLFFGPRRLPSPQASVVLEFDSGDGVSAGKIGVTIGEDATETFANLASALVATLPDAVVVHDQAAARLLIGDRSPGQHGVTFWDETVRSGAFLSDRRRPDYLGVRDVENGFTWVEYATGEKELYDLNADPFQLDNRAKDPAYRATRRRLRLRLRELVAR